MIGTQFENILNELGTIFHKKFQPDKNNSCLLKFRKGISVQIEADGETIIIASEIYQVPQGRFRENVLREALKANGLPLPRNGIFAYSKKNESLVLYDRLPMANLSGAQFADFLKTFLAKVSLWKTSIARGEIPSFAANEQTFGLKGTSQPGIFGLAK